MLLLVTLWGPVCVTIWWVCCSTIRRVLDQVLYIYSEFYRTFTHQRVVLLQQEEKKDMVMMVVSSVDETKRNQSTYMSSFEFLKVCAK